VTAEGRDIELSKPTEPLWPLATERRTNRKRSGYWSKVTTTDSVSVDIGVTNAQETEAKRTEPWWPSAVSPTTTRDQATSPPERETLQEWKRHCGHHTGSGRDMDSAIVAIQHERQENRNRNKTGITGSTTGVDF
jgi:hypothetical protein